MPTTDEAPEIYLAAKAGEAAKVQEILGSNPKEACAVDPSCGGRTALSAAAAAGHTEIVKALLAAGATDTIHRGWSAACHAAYRGHAEVLTTLAAGLGVSATVSPTGASMTPLLLACLKGHLTCASLIIDAAPATLNNRDAHGRTPLMLAASGGSVELIEYLAKRGAPIDEASSEGKTALMWAIAAHKPYAVAALARLGADPEIRAKPDKEAPIQPGKNREIGDSIHDLAEAKNSRDPTVLHISKYLSQWVEQRAKQPEEEAPTLAPLPWMSHAEAWVAAEAAKAAAASTATEEVAAAEPVGVDESDIFDAADAEDEPTIVEEEEPVGGASDSSRATEGSATAAEPATKEDLDDLD